MINEPDISVTVQSSLNKTSSSNVTNVSCDYTGVSPAADLFIKKYSALIELCGNLPIGVVGVILNCVTLVVLSSPSMRNNFFNRLLICLSLFDNVYLLCEVSEVFRHRINTYLHQSIFVYFVYPVRSIFMVSSIYMTIALTFERYFAITSPVEYRVRERTSMTKRLFYYVMPVLSLSILYYIPKWLDLTVGEISDCKKKASSLITTGIDDMNDTSVEVNLACHFTYPLVPTPLRINHIYVFWYINISNLLLTAIIPVAVLTYLNCRIYTSLKQFVARQPSINSSQSASSARHHQTNDVKKVFILFSIVIIFVLCHSIRVILNIDEFINLTRFKEEREKGCDGTNFFSQVIVPINQLLIIINSSANFFIYVFFDKGFQQVLRQACILRSEVEAHGIHNGSNHTMTTRAECETPNENRGQSIEMIDVNQIKE